MRRGGAAAWAAMLLMVLIPAGAQEGPAPTPAPKEYEAPVAQVLAGVQGGIRSVDPAAQTFTIMQPPRHRQPPTMTAIGVNKDTRFVRNEAVTAEQLQVGDAVRVEPQRPAPYGVVIFAEGKVASIAPLTVAVSKEVKVTLAPKAEVALTRIRPMTYEELAPGMEAQVKAYRGTTPLLATEVQVFTVGTPAGQVPSR